MPRMVHRASTGCILLGRRSHGAPLAALLAIDAECNETLNEISA